MEIEIQSKTNNPLLNRTEVYFKISHEGEGTPKRDLIRSELAEKLNVKKENIIINYMKSDFGIPETLGYAKIYKSLEEARRGEKKHILERNKVVVAEEKKEVAPEETAEEPSEKKEEKETVEEPSAKEEESTVEEEPPVEEKKD
jgi:small subunit ribosomal protein S24e